MRQFGGHALLKLLGTVACSGCHCHIAGEGGWGRRAMPVSFSVNGFEFPGSLTAHSEGPQSLQKPLHALCLSKNITGGCSVRQKPP